MTIQYASDLHLEFPENKSHLEKYPLQPAADILILAGDIVPFAVMDRHDAFFDYLNANWKQVYWIPGNHEYYRSDLAMFDNIMSKPIRDNISLLNNKAVTLDGVRIIFSTLWSHISPNNEHEISSRLNDFRIIKDHSQNLSVDRYNALHQENVDFIQSTFDVPYDGKTIVVTHHIPTFLQYPEKYKGDALNEAFASEQYDLIENHQPDAWIFGHHHVNVPEFKIGKTRMLTNQLGYVAYGEDKGFSRDRVLEV